MRTCPRCRESLPFEKFVRDRSRPNNVGVYCRPCHTARAIAWKRANPDKKRFNRFYTVYRLSRAQYDELLARQGDTCPICLNAPAVDVDHDHATGRVRGLLCGSCNRGLGLLKDNPANLQRAIEYLSVEFLLESQ